MLVEHLVLRAGHASLDAVPALRAALAGEGPLRVPTASAGTRLTRVTRAEGLPDDAAFAIGTSGSTGTPKLAVLSATALRASAAATEKAMGGPGQWVLSLPPHHIAGLQVMLRSLAAGHDPVPVERTERFAAHHVTDALARARAAAPDARRYSSFVPTQLKRLLASDDGVAALRGFDAILVGGASTPAEIITRCTDEGVRIITTYGMSETCGGCVYDGQPLPGVRVRLENEAAVEPGGPPELVGHAASHNASHPGSGTPPAMEATSEHASPHTHQATTDPRRVLLGGAPVAHGYLTPVDSGLVGTADVPPLRQADNDHTIGTLTDAGVFTSDESGIRWFRTDDLGHVLDAADAHVGGEPGGDARLVLDGRVDDMIVSGGLKVLPRVVERALEPLLPEGVSVLVVGVPDRQWGHVVGAAFTPASTDEVDALAGSLPGILDAARRELPAYALPRAVAVLPTMPLRGPGKPDRRAVIAELSHRAL